MVQQGNGVCKGHGAVVPQKRCSHEGCANHAKRGGLCYGHGKRESRYVAAMMDAPANPKGEEFARSTVRSLSLPPRGK